MAHLEERRDSPAVAARRPRTVLCGCRGAADGRAGDGERPRLCTGQADAAVHVAHKYPGQRLWRGLRVRRGPGWPAVSRLPAEHGPRPAHSAHRDHELDIAAEEVGATREASAALSRASRVTSRPA